MTDMGDVSRILGTNVTRDRKEGTITIGQKDYTENIVERFGMRGCDPVFTPGAGPDVSLNQPEKNLRDEKGKRRYQLIVRATMYLAQVSRQNILYAVNQLAQGMLKSSKALMGAPTHLLRYLDDFFIAYKQGGFKLAAFSDDNWGTNPENAKPTSSYIFMPANGPSSSRVGIQRLTAQSTTDTQLVAAVLTMKEAVFCKSMIQEVGLKDEFDSVALFIDNTSALYVAENRTYSPLAKGIALRFLHPRAGRGHHDHHPLREDARPTWSYWDQIFQQATSPGTNHQSKNFGT